MDVEVHNSSKKCDVNIPHHHYNITLEFVEKYFSDIKKNCIEHLKNSIDKHSSNFDFLEMSINEWILRKQSGRLDENKILDD